MGFSRAVQRALLDHFFGKATYTPPTTFYLGVSSTLPTSIGGNVTEPSDGNYARQLTQPVDYALATNADPALTLTVSQVTFPVAGADWYAGADINYLVMYDALSGGNFLGYGLFSRAKPVYQDDQLDYPVGRIRIGFQ
jgi:hypothetical protein